MSKTLPYHSSLSWRPRAVSARGFTLLEMVFVLGLIMLIITWVTINVASVDTERQLREASGEIENLARRGRAVAIQQQRPYLLTITADTISIGPKYARAETSEDEEDGAQEHPDVTTSEKMDPEVQYEVRRWMSDEWVLLEEKMEVVIELDPAGLVEPISIRCSHGKSWLIQELHPLTAGVRYEEMSVENDS
ncbi:MAG: pilus assembly FimT family protein [Akkermansiaceae bacterium]